MVPTEFSQAGQNSSDAAMWLRAMTSAEIPREANHVTAFCQMVGATTDGTGLGGWYIFTTGHRTSASFPSPPDQPQCWQNHVPFSTLMLRSRRLLLRRCPEHSGHWMSISP